MRSAFSFSLSIKLLNTWIETWPTDRKDILEFQCAEYRRGSRLFSGEFVYFTVGECNKLLVSNADKLNFLTSAIDVKCEKTIITKKMAFETVLANRSARSLFFAFQNVVELWSFPVSPSSQNIFHNSFFSLCTSPWLMFPNWRLNVVLVSFMIDMCFPNNLLSIELHIFLLQFIVTSALMTTEQCGY